MDDCLIVEASWDASGPWLYVEEPAEFPWEEPVLERYVRKPLPRDLVRDAGRILQASGLMGQVRIEYLQHLDGTVAMFLPGLIGLGSRDSIRVARHLWSTRFRSAEATDYFHSRERLVSWRTLLRAVRRRALTHEAGHAMRAVHCVETPYGRDEELAADYLAGRLDACFRWRADLGALIFETIGCVGDDCTHPSPGERLSAYLHGRRDFRRSMARRVPVS